MTRIRRNDPFVRLISVLVGALLVTSGTSSLASQASRAAAGREVTVVATVHPDDERERAAAARLEPRDFGVLENGRPQKVLSARRAAEAPTSVAVLVQDNVIPAVGNDLDAIERFVAGLPEGSRVMVGYLTATGLRAAEDFTTDRERAARALRIPLGTPESAPAFLYSAVAEAARRFDATPAGRRILVMVSDGFDPGRVARGDRFLGAFRSVDLDRAVRELSRRGVVVYAMYAPGVGPTSFSRRAANYGQGSLNQLAAETGGEAFFSGTTFVSLEPYLRELGEHMDNQWVITYRSSTAGRGFRRLEITTEPGVEVEHPSGYAP